VDPSIAGNSKKADQEDSREQICLENLGKKKISKQKRRGKTGKFSLWGEGVAKVSIEYGSKDWCGLPGEGKKKSRGSPRGR